MRSTIEAFAALCAVIIVVFAVYALGLPGWFALDDGPNILNNSGIHIADLSVDSLTQAAFSRSMGLESRPISMLSFALNYYASGLDAFSFKLTNIVIHIFTGAGLFVLGILLLTGCSRAFEISLSKKQILWVSLAVATAWMLHPLNLTSVLYVVQRMTLLAALFVVLGLIMYVWGRLRICEGKSGLILVTSAFLVCMPLAVLSKANGFLLPLFAGLIEFIIFRGSAKNVYHKKALVAVFLLVFAAPVILAASYLVMHPELITGDYLRREFTLWERLMTEARVLWFYLQMIVVPDNGRLGLFHDDVAISTGMMQPLSTAFSMLGIALLLMGALGLRKRAPVFAFGVLFFLAGHSMESTIFGLELVHEHRNYLPMYGILLPLFYYLFHAGKYTNTLRVRQALGVLLVILFGVGTAVRADNWGDFFSHGLMEVSNHPESPRANYRMGRIYATFMEADPKNSEDYYGQAKEYYEKTISLNSNYTGGLFELIMMSAIHNKPIDPFWVEELESRLRNSPFSAQSITLLTMLVDCVKKGPCLVLKDETGRFLQAAIGNPTFVGKMRAMLLVWKSYYLATFFKNNDEALVLAREAIELSPGVVQFRLHLVALLARTGEFDMAWRELAKAQEIDRLNASTRQIDRQKERLTKATELN